MTRPLRSRYREEAGRSRYADQSFTLLYDTFTDADTTALDEHDPEVGGPWVSTSVAEIDTNQLAATDTIGTATVDIGRVDCRFRLDVPTAPTDEGGLSPAVAMIDSDNLVVMTRLNVGGSGGLILAEITEGVADGIGLDVTPVDGLTYEMVVSGDRVTALVDGIPRGTKTIAPSKAASTLVGFVNQNDNTTNVRFDNLVVTTLP